MSVRIGVKSDRVRETGTSKKLPWGRVLIMKKKKSGPMAPGGPRF